MADPRAPEMSVEEKFMALTEIIRKHITGVTFWDSRNNPNPAFPPQKMARIVFNPAQPTGLKNLPTLQEVADKLREYSGQILKSPVFTGTLLNGTQVSMNCIWNRDPEKKNIGFLTAVVATIEKINSVGATINDFSTRVSTMATALGQSQAINQPNPMTEMVF
jgi:hypothetical protein